MHWRDWKYLQNVDLEDLKGIDYLGDVGVDGIVKK